MLASLSIKNYALIKDIRVDFNSGLTIVTGETGAGKSILLDALSLVLGKRADVKVVRNPSEKCIIEAEFHIADYNLKTLFQELDLDYEDQTFLRREILPNGKTRAFVNDTPASLQQLQDLGNFLIDIHSQFDTQSLFSEAYQLEVIDTLAGNENDLQTYHLQLKEFNTLSETLKMLEGKKQELAKDWDYNQFLYEELRQANLSKIDQVALEEMFEKLNNSEAIKEVLSQSRQLILEDTMGSLSTLTEIRAQLSKIKAFSASYEELWNRVNSLHIELEDISGEIQGAFENLEAQPELLQEIHETLQNLYRLQQKHQVNSVEALQKMEEDLSLKVTDFETIDGTISEIKEKKATVENMLNELAEKLHDERIKVFPKLKEQLGFYLKDLGLPNAQFVFDLRKKDFFRKDGKDELQLLFNANKGVSPGPIQKIASGGELSRVMLSLKAVIAGFKNLPTIVFDEIDTGVSGEIAHKMALIMVQMSKKGQLISITHLPQIAAKGEHHKKVFKVEGEENTVTQIKELTAEERIVEIAQMIGGSTVSESALAHAKQLLN
ncbi:MAG: DNA repair protein RecN [Flavobacteriaceae bacterium]|nr:DNA repair protein RecN [Flavobacteriaceae bacterium]